MGHFTQREEVFWLLELAYTNQTIRLVSAGSAVWNWGRPGFDGYSR